MMEEISAVKLQQKAIPDLMEEMKAPQIQNVEKDRCLMSLGSRVAELEQYTGMNNVSVTGLRIKPLSDARVVTADNRGKPDEQDVSSAEEQVSVFLQSKGTEVSCDNIDACHPLTQRNNSDTPAIIMICERETKAERFQHLYQLASDKRNADIAIKACFLKKQQKLQNTWTTDCKIFIKLNGTPEQAKVLVIRNIEELKRYI